MELVHAQDHAEELPAILWPSPDGEHELAAWFEHPVGLAENSVGTFEVQRPETACHALEACLSERQALAIRFFECHRRGLSPRQLDHFRCEVYGRDMRSFY